MTTSNDELDRLDIMLRILDGITKAFLNLDQMFDELTAEAGQNGVSTEDSDRYAQHCQLLMNLHAIIVTDLTDLRDGLVCECDDSDLLVEHQDDDTYL